jgi:hypothetical protein
LLYHLQVVGIGSNEVAHHQASNHSLKTGWHELNLHGRYFCDQVELAALGDPWALFLGAFVEEVGAGTFDEIPWQLVYLEQPVTSSSAP